MPLQSVLIVISGKLMYSTYGLVTSGTCVSYISTLASVGHSFMMLNATFNNMSVISWWSVLLVKETTDLSQVTDKLFHTMLYEMKQVPVISTVESIP
jgi:hypothetical protein